jgi:hypothetical protein
MLALGEAHGASLNSQLTLRFQSWNSIVDKAWHTWPSAVP